ncbi:MAG: amidase family protein, partial [Anaerolineales bacterium]|nr:amidase family protein [Anaerolineales bacterium]
GIPVGPYLTHTTMEMAVHFENTCVQLEDGGYRLKQVPVMNDFDDIYQRHNLIVAVEAAQTHQGWYQEFGPKYHPKTSQLIERGLKTSSADYEAALQAQQTFRQQFTTLMTVEGIDLWLSPPAQGAAPKGLGSTGDPIMNLPWTYGGFPALNIPVSLNQRGLPMGLQVVAGWNQDEALLEWSLDIEKCLAIKSG